MVSGSGGGIWHVMFRTNKGTNLCFVVLYSLVFLLGGVLAHHVYVDTARGVLVEDRLRLLERRTGAHVLVNDRGELEIKFDDESADDR